MLAENEISVVVSEIDLEAPDAGLALRQHIVKEGKGPGLTWVVLTGKTDRQAAQRAFDLGVDDFVLKPVSTDIFAAKLRQLIERRAQSSGGGAARGVSGLADRDVAARHGADPLARAEDVRAAHQRQPSSGEIDFSDGPGRRRALGRAARRGRLLQDARPARGRLPPGPDLQARRRARSRPRPRRCSSRACAGSTRPRSERARAPGLLAHALIHAPGSGTRRRGRARRRRASRAGSP